MSEPDGFEHSPVMAEEIVAVFAGVPAGTLVDATVGGGGHSALLLASRPDCRLVGLDRDPQAIAAVRRRLEPFGERVTLHHARFDRLAAIMASTALAPVSGVLFDLGVSSPQLDQPERGFSYRAAGPLDMRMDPTGGPSAADLVNEAPAAELARILRDNADERFAARIAAAIVAARPIGDTLTLAEVVREAIPAAARRSGGHPAKRTFQALRIEVNGELEILPGALDQAIDALVPGGRVAVLTYHSGEDRIVKARFRAAASGGCVCPPNLPCVCGAVPTVRIVRPERRRPRHDELLVNRRAESAGLRVVEKLADEKEGS